MWLANPHYSAHLERVKISRGKRNFLHNVHQVRLASQYRNTNTIQCNTIAVLNCVLFLWKLFRLQRLQFRRRTLRFSGSFWHISSIIILSSQFYQRSKFFKLRATVYLYSKKKHYTWYFSIVYCVASPQSFIDS